MTKSISVFGLGYVGTVTAACLARQGFNILGVDLNSTKVEALGAARSPIVESRVSDLVAQSRAAWRIRATSDSSLAVAATEISFLCIDLVNIEKARRLPADDSYQGICW